MFVVWVVSVHTTTLLAIARFAGRGESGGYSPSMVLVISVWLWFTVLFANFAEAMAEAGQRRRLASGRAADDAAKRSTGPPQARAPASGVRRSIWSSPPSSPARPKGRPRARRGRRTRQDHPRRQRDRGGIASVNRSAVTGESRRSSARAGGDRSSVVGGTRCISDWLLVGSAAIPGDTFLDRMIAMVGAEAPEDAQRDRARHPPRGAHHHVPARLP